jgi:tRNA dimethylallyltransferase
MAVYLAQKFNGEIINADSRQVYRYMDIGTAKPSVEDMATVPHHLFNIIDPDDDFSLAQYQEIAYKCIRDIQKRNRVPFLVGGSGQYVRAILEGWEIPRIPPDPEFRKNLESMAAENGGDVLYQRLQELDPAAALKIDKRNIRRVIRALEVRQNVDVPKSITQRKRPPAFKTLIIGLTAERSSLYQRVDSRVEEMIKQGFVGEVEKLLRIGYNFDLSSMNSIGYNQIGMLLRKEVDLEEASRQMKVDNHRFIRHQYAWFRLKDARIKWFDIENDIKPELMLLLANFLDGN